MRRIIWTVIGVLCSLPAAAGAQLLLQAGHRYDFGFDALPLVGPSAGVDQGGFTAFLGSNALDAGEDVRVQLFQNAFTDAPFYTHDFTLPTTLFGATVDLPPAWPDLQGRLSFTMATGSVLLDRLQVRVIRGGQLYQADVPVGGAPGVVPEPSTLVLVLGGAVLALPALGGPRAARRRRGGTPRRTGQA